MVNMCVEINTTRSIAAQILRHRSFSFQEFSQRYAKVAAVSVMPELRSDKIIQIDRTVLMI
jgi:thymidylate synthase (FAD)